MSYYKKASTRHTATHVWTLHRIDPAFNKEIQSGWQSA